MRIALHSSDETARRAGRILLAERSLTALGLYGHEGGGTGDRRTMIIRELDGFDVLASDDPELASALAGIAVDDGLSCVVVVDQVDDGLADRFTAAGATLLLGANLKSGIARSLVAHETTRSGDIESTLVAWTVPGKPRRRGQAVAFPDPVGPRWGRLIGKRRKAGPHRSVQVPIAGEWAAASVAVTGLRGGERTHRVIGVADHANHLDGVALAAGVIAVAEGAYGPGVRTPDEHADAYLAAALRVGLGVAAYTE